MALLLLAAALLPAGCASPRWETVTYGQFALNRGRAAGGRVLIKVVVVLQGAGDLGEAVAIELARRGFVVRPLAAVSPMAAGVDFNAVMQHRMRGVWHIPDYRSRPPAPARPARARRPDRRWHARGQRRLS